MPCKQLFVMLIVGLCLPPPASGEEARTLLQQCLPSADSGYYRARVEIEVTHKNKPAESYHYLRLETPQRLFITPDKQQGPALLMDKQAQQVWHYDTETERLSDANTVHIPLWLSSETLLRPQQLRDFKLTLTSHNSFGGLDYYNVNASHSDAPYPKRSLSFKRSQNGDCNLIRAAYFNTDDKLSKKLFFQWQSSGGAKKLKALHLEDVQTLESVRYHVEALEAVKEINSTRFPAPLQTPGME